MGMQGGACGIIFKLFLANLIIFNFFSQDNC